MTLKIITYNVDGLPSTIDLRELPWLLKPLSWGYNLVKGTTEIKVNNNDNRKEHSTKIGKWFKEQNPDIICVQENFNYHAEITEELGEQYITGTYKGGVNIQGLLSAVRWFPYPRIKDDGLNVFAKAEILKERVVTWNKTHGYFKHCNDRLALKGFRLYQLFIGGRVIDVYNCHMDAGSTEKDIAAIASQCRQLASFVIENERDCQTPFIITGDMNCWKPETYNIVSDNLYKPIENIIGTLSETGNVADRIAVGRGTIKEFSSPNTGLSDHKPICTVIEV